MSITFCHCDSAISSAGAALAIPALFTARLSGPSSLSVCFTASVRLARSVTSPATGMVRRPRSVIAAHVSSRPGPARSKQAMSAPEPAAARAIARPMPLPAPVISAVWLSSRKLGVLIVVLSGMADWYSVDGKVHHGHVGPVGAVEDALLLAAGQDQHSVRQAEDFLELGADHDDRHALSGESHDHVVDRLPGADIDAAGRLVEDHDLGFTFQPLGDDDLLLVATGQCPGRLFDPSLDRHDLAGLGGDVLDLAGADESARSGDALQIGQG